MSILRFFSVATFSMLSAMHCLSIKAADSLKLSLCILSRIKHVHRAQQTIIAKK